MWQAGFKQLLVSLTNCSNLLSFERSHPYVLHPDLCSLLAAISELTFNSKILNTFILLNECIKSMKGHHFNFKKGFMVFHTLSGVLTLLSIFLFIQSGQYPCIYKSFLLSYFISGVVILTIFFRTLRPFQKSYFELLFSVPFLIMAFWFLTKLFGYLFFG
jgi:hypothetical protein